MDENKNTVLDEDEDANADEANEQEKLNDKFDEKYGPRRREGLRKRKARCYDHLNRFNDILAMFQDPVGELFLTEQMNVKKGLHTFGERGATAVVKELQQLDNRQTIEPQDATTMTREQKRQAL